MAGIFKNAMQLAKYMISPKVESPSEVYKSPPSRRVQVGIEEIPPLRLDTIERMEHDPQVALGLFVRNGLLSALEVEPDPKNPGNAKQVAWALREWDWLWQTYSDKLMRASLTGFLGFEVKWGVHTDGTRTVCALQEFHPRDTKPLVSKGRPVGVRFRGNGGMRNIDLFAPRSLWVNYKSMYGDHFGDTVMRPAYLPWYKKWMEHGVEKSTTLFMLKHAVTGRVIWVSNETVPTIDGQQISLRDLMREIEDNRMTMAAQTVPLLRDAQGNKKIEIEDGKVASSMNPYEWWADDTGRSIWKGLGILPEIMEAMGTGSFSGRSIPLLAVLSVLMTQGNEIFRAVCRDILLPGCWASFGSVDFKLRVKPLAETYKEDMQGGEGGGSQPANMAPNRPMIPHANSGNSMQFDEGSEDRVKAAAGALSELMRGRIGDALKKKVGS